MKRIKYKLTVWILELFLAGVVTANMAHRMGRVFRLKGFHYGR
jgi:hypothetical protein